MHYKVKLPTHEQIEQDIESGRRNIERIRALGPSDNSALTWFPPIEAAGLPVPRTIFVPFYPNSLFPIVDGKPAIDFPMDHMVRACEEIGYPVFIRTDLSSAKHDGPSAYRADSPDDLWRCVSATFHDNAMKDLAPFVRAFMIREWLNLDGSFTAFRGHLISREWRLFVDKSGVKCSHFYWPVEAIEDHTKEPKYRELLDALSSEPNEMRTLRTMAEAAVNAIGHGDWSVDLARDVSGKWWLTDMASSRSSWHPKH